VDRKAHELERRSSGFRSIKVEVKLLIRNVSAPEDIIAPSALFQIKFRVATSNSRGKS
jgi:hypothetical protein